jgi:hypothetical protein
LSVACTSSWRHTSVEGARPERGYEVTRQTTMNGPTDLPEIDVILSICWCCCYLLFPWISFFLVSLSKSLSLSLSPSLDLYLPSSKSTLFSRSSTLRKYTCVHVFVFNTLEIRTPLFVYLVYLVPLFYHLLSILAFSKHIYHIIITISSHPRTAEVSHFGKFEKFWAAILPKFSFQLL